MVNWLSHDLRLSMSSYEFDIGRKGFFFEAKNNSVAIDCRHIFASHPISDEL